MKNKEKLVSYLFATFLVFVFLVLWETLARTGVIRTFLLSSPTMVFEDLRKIILTGIIFPHIGVTLAEMSLGLIAGTLVGIIVAFFLDRFEFLDRTFNPIFTALNGLPKMALAPLFI